VDFDLIRAILSIVVIDLVLSGDNAVVIGMASRRLPPSQRRKAIILGAVGAIGLRVTFTAMIALLLGIPLLQAFGGLLLVWIAFKLLRQEHSEANVREGANLFDAVRTIIIADVIMSLDNILAVGGAAHGDLALLLFGLALSMPIIMFGSNLVAVLMNRLPWLVYLGSAILAYTAGEMIFEDPIVHDRLIKPYLSDTTLFEYSMIGLLMIGTIGLAYLLNQRQHSHPGTLPPPEETDDDPPAAESETVGVGTERHAATN
jgi:YjbE family integral membrane protein